MICFKAIITRQSNPMANGIPAMTEALAATNRNRPRPNPFTVFDLQA
jgi:hypothetical protein